MSFFCRSRIGNGGFGQELAEGIRTRSDGAEDVPVEWTRPRTGDNPICQKGGDGNIRSEL